MEEFFGKPIEQPAHLGAGGGVVRQKPVPAQGEAARLVEIFGDRPWAREDHAGFFNENRRLPSRIEDEEIPSALEGLFFDEFGLMAYSREGAGRNANAGIGDDDKAVIIRLLVREQSERSGRVRHHYKALYKPVRRRSGGARSDPNLR